MDFVRSGDFEQYAVTCMSNLSAYNAWTGADKELEAKAYFYLGRAYWVMGALNEAKVLFEKSKANSEVLFGPNHPWTLWSCNNLAIILTEQKKYAEACEYAELAVNGMTATFGAEHDETAIAKDNYSVAKRHQNKQDPSIPPENELDWNRLLSSASTQTPPPASPSLPALITVDHEGDLGTLPAVIPAEDPPSETPMKIWRVHRNDGEDQQLDRRIQDLLYTFEHNERSSTSLGYSSFSTTRVHFYAAMYVFLGRLKKASQLYLRALPTARKAGVRGTPESSLRSNSRLLDIITYRLGDVSDRDRQQWQKDASTILKDLTDCCEKEDDPAIRSLFAGIATLGLYPYLAQCKLVDYYEDPFQDVEESPHRATQQLGNSPFDLLLASVLSIVNIKSTSPHIGNPDPPSFEPAPLAPPRPPRKKQILPRSSSIHPITSCRRLPVLWIVLAYSYPARISVPATG